MPAHAPPLRSSAAAPPRWENNRVLFEIEDGEHRIECAIYRQALEEVAGRRLGRPPELLACFNTSRRRIERLALLKARAQGLSVGGPVTLWSGDLEPGPDDTGDSTKSADPTNSAP